MLVVFFPFEDFREDLQCPEPISNSNGKADDDDASLLQLHTCSASQANGEGYNYLLIVVKVYDGFPNSGKTMHIFPSVFFNIHKNQHPTSLPFG